MLDGFRGGRTGSGELILVRALLLAFALFSAASGCTQRFPGPGGPENKPELIALAALLGSSRWLSYNPGSVSGLILWLKAESINQTNGTTLSAWPDLSGTGNNLAAGTAPTFYSTSIHINNRPVVRFASGDSMTKAAFAGLPANDSGSIFIVFRPTALAVFGLFDIGGCGGNGRQPGYNNGVLFEMNKACVGQVAVPPINWPAMTTHQIAILQNNTTNIVMRMDAAQLVSQTPALTGYATSGTMTLGGQEDLAELLIYSSRIPDADAQAIECYLGARYGILNCL